MAISFFGLNVPEFLIREEGHCYALQETFVADQLFQSSEHCLDDLLWISHSLFSSMKVALPLLLFYYCIYDFLLLDCYFDLQIINKQNFEKL